MLKFRLLLATLIFISFNINAQLNQKKIEIIGKSQFIFEGIPRSSQCYYASNDSSSILTSSIVEITKIFRGNNELKLGTIEIITQGGYIPVYKKVGGEIQNVAPIHSHSEEGVISNYNAYSHIFFCIKSSTIANKGKLLLDNSFAVQSYCEEKDCSVKIKGSGNGDVEVDGLGSTYKFSKDFYNELKNFPNLTFKENKDLKEADNLSFQIDTVKLQEKNKRHWDSVTTAKKKKASLRSSNTNLESLTGVHSLSYSFTNSKLTSTGSGPTFLKFFEFDINVQSTSTGSYLDQSLLFINYNVATFGSYIGSNNKLTVSLSPSFSVNYSVSFNSDLNSNSLQFNIDAATARPNFIRTQVPVTNSIPLIHCKIQVLDCNLNTGLQFFQNHPTYTGVNMNSYNKYVTNPTYPFTGSGVEYSPINISNILNSKACQVEISGFIVSNNQSAGTESVVTIKGKNFGNTRSSSNGTFKGEVRFKDADDNSNSYLINLDDQDYLINGSESWTDTEIKVKVPSRVTKNYPAGSTHSAGSGTVKVDNYYGISGESINAIDILYSVSNSIDVNDGNKKSRVNLSRAICNDDIVFRLGRNVPDVAIPTIEKVLKIYSDEFRIGIRLDKDVNGVIIKGDYSSENSDNINTIFFGTPTGTELMLTSTYANSCSSTLYNGVNQKRTSRKESDIRISSSANFYYPESGDLPIGKYDFFHAFSHEIGHALGLGHVIDPNSLMHRTGIVGFKYSYQRFGLYNTARGAAITGISDISNYSKGVTWNCTDMATLVGIPAVLQEGGCFGSDINLFAYYSPQTYNWYNSANVLVATNTSTYTPVSVGRYYVSFKYSTCVSSKVSIDAQVLGGGACDRKSSDISEDVDSELVLFPNPTKDIVYFKRDIENCNLRVHNANGLLVESIDVTLPIAELNLDRLTTGIYMVTITNSFSVNRIKLNIVK